MEAAGLDKNTILYALSTLAQTCAALLAFIGALGLYRLQSLSGSTQEMYRNLRGLLASVGKAEWKPDVLSLLPDRRVREIANNAVASPEGLGQERIRDALVRELDRRKVLGGAIRRTQRLLLLFGGWNLLAIAVAILGFDFVSTLAGCRLVSLGLWASALGTALFTGMMISEVTGSLPRYLNRRGLRWFLKYLEHEYRRDSLETEREHT